MYKRKVNVQEEGTKRRVECSKRKKAFNGLCLFVLLCFLWLLLLDLLDQSQSVVAGDEWHVFVRAEILEQLEELARI